MSTSAVATSSSAAPPRPDGAKRADLVLEGGGVKGIGLAGAVLTLSAAGYSYPRVAGTSAGAITAALVAALQTAGEPLTNLQEYLETVDYSKFEQANWLQRRFGKIAGAERLLRHMGLYSGDYLTVWLGGLLDRIGITTFGQLKMVDAGSSLPEACRYSLVVHTSDITRGRLVRLPWDYPNYGLDPDGQRIVDAVRASMAIPFFFDPVRFKATAATYEGVSYPAGAVMWVDGGLLSNFPIEVFDRTDGQPARWPTIGMKLAARQTTMPPGRECDDTFDEAVDCLRTLLANADRYYLTPDKVARTMFIDTGGVTATDFHINAQQQAMLFANGQQAAAAWLARPANA